MSFPKEAIIDSNLTIQAARERYLETRGCVLEQFYNPSECQKNPDSDFVSANGDVKSDIIFLRRHADRATLPPYTQFLHVIYGIEELSEPLGDTLVAADEHLPSWVAISQHLIAGAQSFTEMSHEAIRAFQDRRHTNSLIQKRVYESDDMTAILNARGTVMLNMSFFAHVEQLPIIKLASLAVSLWGELSRHGTNPDDEETKQPNGVARKPGLCSSDIIHRLIMMIRDDIQNRLLTASTSLHPSWRNDQDRHVKVLHESVITWQRMVSKQITPEWKDLAVPTLRLRDRCNEVLCYESSQHRNYLRWPVLFQGQIKVISDHGSEWMGPLLKDENDKTPTQRIAIPLVDRNEDGYWFRA